MSQGSLRTQAMVRLFSSGFTYKMIGERHALSSERVRQILFAVGVSRKDGGKAVQAKKQELRRARYKDLLCIRKYGCSLEQLRTVRHLDHKMRESGISIHRGPFRSFSRQR